MATASDPPDSAVNPASGFIEIVDATLGVGSNYNIRHVVNPGGGDPPAVLVLSNNSLDDLDPRIRIGPGGDTWVVWWRDGSTDEVLCRVHDYSTDTWSSEHALSTAEESARNPEIVYDGTNAWVAYEFNTTEGIGIGVLGIEENPDPFGRDVVATTSFTGDVDTRIHAESGNLWVTWVDNATYVGWSEYSHATSSWASPGYESYASDSVSAARARVRTTVLNN